MKVLVPVDGSPSSDRAVAHALAMVRHLPTTELRLINVQEPVDTQRLHDLTRLETMERVLREKGVHETASARDAVTQARVYTECPIEIGEIAPTIARYAKDHGFDLIVMGTRGLGRIKSLVLGSIAHKVIHLTEVPVTLVK